MDLRVKVAISLVGIGLSLIAIGFFFRRLVRNMHNAGGNYARSSATTLIELGGFLTFAGGKGFLEETGLI